MSSRSPHLVLVGTLMNHVRCFRLSFRTQRYFQALSIRRGTGGGHSFFRIVPGGMDAWREME